MKIVIRHQLTVPLGAGSARAVEHLLLTPVSGSTQSVKEWSIDLPGIETAAKFLDAHGNKALLVGQTKPEGELTVTVSGVVETQDRAGVLGRLTGEPVVALYRRMTDLTKPDERFLELFKDADRSSSKRIGLLHAVMARIGEVYRFGEIIEDEPETLDEDAAKSPPVQSQSQNGQSQSQGGQTQSQVGEPPDDDGPAEPDDREQVTAEVFAHAFLGTVRALDIPARYVTGYLAADEEQPAAFHAWAEAYDDSLGWIGFDPALGICPADRHVRVAAGLDALSTAPIRVVPEAGAATVVSIEVAAQ
jgi:hypothetical protein